MKFLRNASAVALILVLAASPARTEPLAPTAKWRVDFGDTQCIAMRDYGSAEKPLFLMFRPAPLGDVMQVTVLRPRASKDIDQYRGTMRIDGGAAVPISVLGFPSPSGKDRISSINLPMRSFEAVRNASTLRLQSGGELDYEFTLTQMAAVSRTLDQCSQTLRDAWHIGAAASAIRQDARSKVPLPRLFSSDDYPTVALNTEAVGTVELMTLIDEAGNVASCMVIGTSGYASLDAQSCAIVRNRAKFHPAIGKDGKPVRSGLIQRIRWDVPLL